MPIAIATTKDENAVVGTTDIQDSVRGESFGRLRTGLSNHEQPFDKLRANGLESIFVIIY